MKTHSMYYSFSFRFRFFTFAGHTKVGGIVRWYLDLQINTQYSHTYTAVTAFYWIKYIFVDRFSMDKIRKETVISNVCVCGVSPLTFLKEGSQHTNSKKNVLEINEDTQIGIIYQSHSIGGYRNRGCAVQHMWNITAAVQMTKYYENTPQ